MDDRQVAEVCSTIGNTVRVASVIALDEVTAVCVTAASAPLDRMLLDPHRYSVTAGDNLQNLLLLEAFAQFRWQIEMIRRGWMPAKTPRRVGGSGANHAAGAGDRPRIVPADDGTANA